MIPKFRAWDKEIKMMIEISLIDFEKHVMLGTHWKFGETESIKFDEIELMQSTGLFDEYGKEIFEGDIVLIYGEKISKVFYSQGSFCVDILNGGTPLHGFSPKQLEVIGNIYENPELLEEE